MIKVRRGASGEWGCRGAERADGKGCSAIGRLAESWRRGALAGALLTAGPASAASRGFKLHNESTRTLRLESATPIQGGFCFQRILCFPTGNYALDFEGRPRDGQLFPPNFPPHDWELKWAVGITTYAALLRYEILRTDGFVEYAILNKVTNQSIPFPISTSRCEVVPSSVGHCTAERLELTFQNPLAPLGGPGNDRISGGPADSATGSPAAGATTGSPAAGATTGSPAAGATTGSPAAGATT